MYFKYAVLNSDRVVRLRPASKFVETAKKFESKITIINDNEQIDAKSFRGLCASDLGEGSRITLQAEGPDEREAIITLFKLIEDI